MSDHFDITLTGRLRHAALWRLVRKHGSQSKLARALGIEVNLFCDWVNMKRVPNLKNPKHFAAALKLCEMADMAIDEMWPEESRSREWLNVPKQVECDRRVHRENLLEWKSRNSLALPPPEVAANEEDVSKLIDEAMAKHLNPTEKRVMELRWGLNGERPHTFKEIGKIVKKTSARAQQISRRAQYKLKLVLGSLIPELEEK